MWVCTEWLGSGLQIRAMQVRPLSPTPNLAFTDGFIVSSLQTRFAKLCVTT